MKILHSKEKSKLSIFLQVFQSWPIFLKNWELLRNVNKKFMYQQFWTSGNNFSTLNISEWKSSPQVLAVLMLSPSNLTMPKDQNVFQFHRFFSRVFKDQQNWTVRIRSVAFKHSFKNKQYSFPSSCFYKSNVSFLNISQTLLFSPNSINDTKSLQNWTL